MYVYYIWYIYIYIYTSSAYWYILMSVKRQKRKEKFKNKINILPYLTICNFKNIFKILSVKSFTMLLLQDSSNTLHAQRL